VPARQLVRCTRPTGGRYAQREELAPPALAHPVALGVGPLDLEALLAGLE
jgi:hypothetical protein